MYYCGLLGRYGLTWSQEWNGECFERITLKEMGLRIQLGHTGFETCDNPVAAHQDFTVIHWNGIHPAAVDYCGCASAHQAGERREQVLRRSWFPATTLEPQTCATFRLLEVFHIMTLQGKVTTYDYYSGLEKLRDNTGLQKLKVRTEYSYFVTTLTQLSIGSIQIFYAHHAGVAAHRDAETRRSRKRREAQGGGYAARRASCGVSSVPQTRGKFAR
jgi:hypothetical protein